MDRLDKLTIPPLFSLRLFPGRKKSKSGRPRPNKGICIPALLTPVTGQIVIYFTMYQDPGQDYNPKITFI